MGLNKYLLAFLEKSQQIIKKVQPFLEKFQQIFEDNFLSFIENYLLFLIKSQRFLESQARALRDLIVFSILFRGVGAARNEIGHKLFIFFFLFGFSGGLVLSDIIHLHDFISLYDVYPFESLTPSFDETKILSDDINSIDEKNLKNQEDIKIAEREDYLKLIAITIIICYIVFFSQ